MTSSALTTPIRVGREGRLRGSLRFDLVDLSELRREVELAVAVLAEGGNATRVERAVGRGGADELAVLDDDGFDRAVRPGGVEVAAAQRGDLAPAVDHAADHRL